MRSAEISSFSDADTQQTKNHNLLEFEKIYVMAFCFVWVLCVCYFFFSFRYLCSVTTLEDAIFRLFYRVADNLYARDMFRATSECIFRDSLGGNRWLKVHCGRSLSVTVNYTI